MDTQAVRAYLLDLQDRITTAASALDGGTFVTDAWEKPPTERLRGSGRTRILEGGTEMRYLVLQATRCLELANSHFQLHK